MAVVAMVVLVVVVAMVALVAVVAMVVVVVVVALETGGRRSCGVLSTVSSSNRLSRASALSIVYLFPPYWSYLHERPFPCFVLIKMNQ